MHSASLEAAARHLHFLPLMPFYLIRPPPSPKRFRGLTGCHAAASYDITPLAATPLSPPVLIVTGPGRYLGSLLFQSIRRIPSVCLRGGGLFSTYINIFFFLHKGHGDKEKKPQRVEEKSMAWRASECRSTGRGPVQPRDRRCFGRPNGILMFISAADMGGGGDWDVGRR